MTDPHERDTIPAPPLPERPKTIQFAAPDGSVAVTIPVAQLDAPEFEFIVDETPIGGDE